MVDGFLTVDENNDLPAAVQGKLNATYATKEELAGIGSSGATYGTQAFAELGTYLDTGANMDTAIAVFGDSTSNDGNEWFRLTADSVALNNPDLRVEITTWSDATQAYDYPPDALRVLQEGSFVEGGIIDVVSDDFNRTAAQLLGTTPQSGGAWSGFNASSFSLNGTGVTVNGGTGWAHSDGGATGDMTAILGGVTLDTTATGASRQLQVHSKRIDSSNYIYAYVNISDTGGVSAGMYKKIAGTTTALGASQFSIIPASTVSTFDMELTVTGLNVSATIAGATFNATLTQTDADALATATLAGVESRSAIGATIDSFTLTADGGVGSGQRVQFFNASHAGSTLEYQRTRVASMLPKAPDAVILSSCHNYGTATPATYLAEVDATVTAITDLHLNAKIIASSQNAEFVGTFDQAANNAHLRRLTELRLKARNEQWGYLPVLEAFLSLPDKGQSLINSDGIHPTPDGSRLWADTVLAQLASAQLVK